MSKATAYLTLLSIPFLLYLCLILGFLGVIPLKSEIHSIVIVGLIFAIYLFFIPHNSIYGLQGLENSSEHLDREVSRYLREFSLEMDGKTKSTGSVDSFFDGYYRDFRNNNYSSIASSLFPTLGILGTFISIAISMPNFSVGDAKGLEEEVSKLLMGTGTAFYASIYGIFLSIWWILFEKRGMSFISNKIKNFRESFKPYIWDEDELKHAELQERLQAQRNLLNITETLTGEEYLSRVSDIAKLRYQEIENLSKNQIEITNNSSVLISNLLDATKGSLAMQDEIVKHSEQLKESMEELLERMERRLDSSDTIVSAFKGEMYNLLSSIERIAGEIKIASVKFSESNK